MNQIFNRSFLTLLAALALTLASCSGGDISKRRAAATGAGKSTTTGTSATPGAPADPLADVTTAVAGLVEPSANGTPAPQVFVWSFANSPTALPTPTTDTNCSHTGLCGWDVLQNSGGGK